MYHFIVMITFLNRYNGLYFEILIVPYTSFWLLYSKRAYLAIGFDKSNSNPIVIQVEYSPNMNIDNRINHINNTVGSRTL